MVRSELCQMRGHVQRLVRSRIGIVSDTVGMSFIPHPEADQRRRSAEALIKMLLADRTPEALPEHIRKLIDTMLWKLTESDGKHNTRHRSDGAMPHSDPRLLHHEHVFPKKKMIDDLQRASSSDEHTSELQSLRH